jgi:hypothetical protein
MTSKTDQQELSKYNISNRDRDFDREKDTQMQTNNITDYSANTYININTDSKHQALAKDSNKTEDDPSNSEFKSNDNNLVKDNDHNLNNPNNKINNNNSHSPSPISNNKIISIPLKDKRFMNPANHNN